MSQEFVFNNFRETNPGSIDNSYSDHKKSNTRLKIDKDNSRNSYQTLMLNIVEEVTKFPHIVFIIFKIP